MPTNEQIDRLKECIHRGVWCDDVNFSDIFCDAVQSVVGDNFAAPELPKINADVCAAISGLIYDDGHITGRQADAAADRILTHFAAPERKPWACTEEQAELIDRRFFSEDCKGKTHVQLRSLINEVLALQPAPVEAEQRCANCGHIEGILHQGERLCANRGCSCFANFHRERGAV